MSGKRGTMRRSSSHHDFSENLDRLSDELGIELELENTEVQIGPYRADIVARIPQDDTRVLIENQLESANLQHR